MRNPRNVKYLTTLYFYFQADTAIAVMNPHKTRSTTRNSFSISSEDTPELPRNSSTGR